MPADQGSDYTLPPSMSGRSMRFDWMGVPISLRVICSSLGWSGNRTLIDSWRTQEQCLPQVRRSCSIKRNFSLRDTGQLILTQVERQRQRHLKLIKKGESLNSNAPRVEARLKIKPANWMEVFALIRSDFYFIIFFICILS